MNQLLNFIEIHSAMPNETDTFLIPVAVLIVVVYQGLSMYLKNKNL
ncbi:MAG: hypothetical protein HRU25_04950 [Psychrobium sp.]|nr:hypothetical protein [Psychrobium sp.]